MPTSASSQSALETRLFKRLDEAMSELNRKTDRLGEKIDRLAEDRVTREEYDALRQRVDAQATQVAVQDTRLRTLETGQNAEDNSRRQRPFTTWQMVLATLSLAMVLFFDFITATISIIRLLTGK